MGPPNGRKGRRARQFGALLTQEGASDPPGPSAGRPPKSSDASHTLSAPQPEKDLLPTVSGRGARLKPSQQAKPKPRFVKPKKTSPQVTPSSTTIHPVEDPDSKRSADAADATRSSSLDPRPGRESPPCDPERETCLICAEPVRYYALGTCSHRTCHVCTIRMRALYKKRDCALCKTELPEVILSRDPQRPFDSYDLSTFEFKDPHLSVYCESFDQLDELLAYLKFNCPHPDCPSVLTNWSDLKAHTRAAHGLSLCDLCCSHKKVFAHEHTLFSHKALAVHRNQGSVGIGRGLRGAGFKHQDRRLGGEEPPPDDGFKGHPRCGFCTTYFYDDDQLYQHCREKHEQCFICVRTGIGRWQYYLDYKHLESHFRDDHHLCSHSACLQARFVVYETALELQAHQIEAHGAEMGVKAVRDARKVETNFVCAGSGEQNPQIASYDRTAREQRAGRGVTVMNIPPITGEGSSSALSNADRIVPGLAPSNRVKSNARRSDKGKSKSAPTPQAENSHLTSSSDSNPLEQGCSKTAADPNVQRHAMLIQRVYQLANGAEAKVASFKVAVRTYRNNEMAAPDFLDMLCNIFDSRSETIGSILSHLLDLLDIDDERKGQLLEKWLDHKLEQSQYPSLDASSSRSLAGDNLSSTTQNFTGQNVLSTSRWIRGQPNYSKIFEGSTRTCREAPGVVSKKIKTPIHHSTPWASNATVSILSQPQPQPSSPIRSSSSSALANPHARTEQFPSLPKKAASSTQLPPHLKNGDRIPTNGNKPSNLPATMQSSNPWAPPANEPLSTPINPSKASGSKKSKKIILFTNAR